MLTKPGSGNALPAPCRDHVSSRTLSGDGRPPDRRTLALVTAAAVLVGVLLAAVPSSSTAPGEGVSPPSPQAGLRTVVIDPGHGGQEVGALGPGGIRESEITLDIALRLRELVFRRIGIDVHLTRDSDVDLSLDRRTERANNWGGGLFLSIHANAYRGNSIRGPETYFLSANATDEAARRVAGNENAVAGDDAGPAPEAAPPGQEPLDLILWDLAQTAHLRESSLFAELVQAELNDLWQIRDRGVKQAPFRVLKGATMPAILVEVGFLSNPEDARRLGDPAFRARIAEALFRALERYRQQYAVLVGAAPAP